VVTTPPKKTVAVASAGILLALVPALLGYMQNRDEIRAKYNQSQSSAESSYDIVATTVKQLQAATLAQHDYIVKMQAQIEMLQVFVLSRMPDAVSGVGGRPPVTRVEPPPAPKFDPLKRPTYGKLPDRFDDVQLKK
jgi:hypothetical protein